MNLEKEIIFIKGEERTKDVVSYRFEKTRCFIKFNSGKEYPFGSNNIRILKDPKLIDLKGKQLYINGKLYLATKILYQFKGYVKRIDESGKVEVYKKPKIELKELLFQNQNAKNTLHYLTQLSEVVGVIEGNSKNSLAKHYDSLKDATADSALRYLITPQSLSKAKDKGTIVFPFGFNLSQKKATELAMTHQLSVIEGPPGTGKTQSILSIVANCLINGKTVAIVSNNNSATQNVVEKLKKYELDFLTAYLGNLENQKAFIASQTGDYPDMKDWLLDQEARQQLQNELTASEAKLNEMLSYQNDRADLRKQIAELELEERHFEDYRQESGLYEVDFKIRRALSSKKWLQLLLQLEEKNYSRKISLWERVKNFFLYGITSKVFYLASNEAKAFTIHSLYYQKRKDELQIELAKLEKKLADYSFEDEMARYSEKSMVLLKASLFERFGKKESRPLFTTMDLRQAMDSVTNEYPIVLSSTHSLRNNLPKNGLFDYVLVDESSQVDVVTGALALSCAKNVVIVGDSKQLPNIVTPQHHAKVVELHEKFQVLEALRYDKYSLLTALFELYPGIPSTLLQEHYRCHPKIIDYCNKKFYNNELIILSEAADDIAPLRVIQTVKGSHQRERFNQRQIDVITHEVLPSLGDTSSIGIISPYRQQVQEIARTIQNSKIESDTVHRFQGREKDVIILSTVASDVKPNDFVDDANLINVAVSRAVDQLILIVSNTYPNWKNTNLSDLIGYIRHQQVEVEDSKIYSVFDVLYKDYEQERQLFNRRRKKISDFESENLMYDLLTELFKKTEYQKLDIVVHQPLRMLVRDYYLLTTEERRFISNINTHTDFVIYNKLDKQPILVIEVDGYGYHNKPEQIERDRKKDAVLTKYNIPILRLNTTGSEESEKISRKLDELLGISKVH